MQAMLGFQEHYGTNAACIEALARRRWPRGYACGRCGHDRSWRLAARPRTFECARCGHQEPVTAGTVFHRTRTPLRKWLLAAWWMARDKRGVSALFLSRDLGGFVRAAVRPGSRLVSDDFLATPGRTAPTGTIRWSRATAASPSG